jgi:N-acetylglutamate synthase-like GNAT family acetyltransferase
VSEDAVQLATVVVFPGNGDAGLGRALVQVMARDLVRRGGVRAVEAITCVRADGRSDDHPGQGAGEGEEEDAVGGPEAYVTDSACPPVPAEFLQRVGFTTVRAHPRHPRLRLELRSLVSWREEVGTAWERIRGAVRPVVRPVPASRHVGLTDGHG